MTLRTAFKKRSSLKLASLVPVLLFSTQISLANPTAPPSRGSALLDCFRQKAESIAHVKQPFVDQPVPGLYHSIPAVYDSAIGPVRIHHTVTKGIYKVVIKDYSKKIRKVDPMAWHSRFSEVLGHLNIEEEKGSMANLSLKQMSTLAQRTIDETLAKMEVFESKLDSKNLPHDYVATARASFYKTLENSPDVQAVAAYTLKNLLLTPKMIAALEPERGQALFETLRDLKNHPEHYVSGLGDSRSPFIKRMSALIPDVSTYERDPDVLAPVSEAKPASGDFTRKFEDRGKTMIFQGAGLDSEVPTFIQHDGPVLVKGRGTPTQAYLTLQQMRLKGIPYGGLKHAKTNHIVNTRTWLELAANPEIKDWIHKHPGETEVLNALIAKFILKTNTGRYIQTVLTQSGHRIKSITVSGVKFKILKLTEYANAEVDPRTRDIAPLVPPKMPLPTYFTIDFELEPIQASKPR